MAVVLIALTSAGCNLLERKPKVVADERVEVHRGEIRAVPFEIDRSCELQLEVSNLDGEPLYVYLINRSEKSNLENKLEWRYFTAFSHPELKEKFDSGWRKIKGPGIYDVILSPHDKNLTQAGATQPPTIARVRISTR
jgi:hypothetical protein